MMKKMKPKGMKSGGVMKTKGYKAGGKVKAKGMKMGGKVKPKGMKMGGKVYQQSVDKAENKKKIKKAPMTREGSGNSRGGGAALRGTKFVGVR